MDMGVSEAYEELGAEQPVLFDDTDGFDLEAINDCKPDIILCAYSGITQEDYDALTAIAPVVPPSRHRLADVLARADHGRRHSSGHGRRGPAARR